MPLINIVKTHNIRRLKLGQLIEQDSDSTGKPRYNEAGKIGNLLYYIEILLY